MTDPYSSINTQYSLLCTCVWCVSVCSSAWALRSDLLCFLHMTSRPLSLLLPLVATSADLTSVSMDSRGIRKCPSVSEKVEIVLPYGLEGFYLLLYVDKLFEKLESLIIGPCITQFLYLSKLN